jgi:hypothetical protein
MKSVAISAFFQIASSKTPSILGAFSARTIFNCFLSLSNISLPWAKATVVVTNKSNNKVARAIPLYGVKLGFLLKLK